MVRTLVTCLAVVTLIFSGSACTKKAEETAPEATPAEQAAPAEPAPTPEEAPET